MVYTLKHNLTEIYISASFILLGFFIDFLFFLLNIPPGYVLILESCARLLIYLRKAGKNSAGLQW